jgi:hypothetical protein
MTLGEATSAIRRDDIDFADYHILPIQSNHTLITLVSADKERIEPETSLLRLF